MNPEINFFYTLAKISATLVGLVFVAVVSFYIPNLSRVRDELKGLSPLLKLKFPDYLININISNLTTLFLPLFISFNFILIDTYSKWILALLFILYILPSVYFIFRVQKTYLSGDRNIIKKQIGRIIYFRVFWLPPLIFLISFIIILFLNIPNIREMNFGLISSILILFGLILVFFDCYMFKPETLFFQIDQIPFRILRKSIQGVNKHLQSMKGSLLEPDQKMTLEEICKPIEELEKLLDSIEKSNIVVANSLLDAKESFFALKELSKKSPYKELFTRFKIFEEESNERSNHI